MKTATNRKCGDCISCCVYLRINEIEKPPMSHCVHLSLVGPTKKNEVYYTGKSKCGNCTIYKTRPPVCAEYKCTWLEGYGDEGDRPDRSLILFDNTKKIGNAITAKPLAYLQEESEEGKKTIERMSRSTGKPVIVLNFYERRVKRIVGEGLK